MPDEQLPEEFDVFVYGTGMPESIAAAAYSRVGERVLHIDRYDNYGSFWTSFSLDQLSSFAHSALSNGSQDNQHSDSVPESQLHPGETIVKLRLDEQVFHVTERWYVPTALDVPPVSTTSSTNVAPMETVETSQTSTASVPATLETPADASCESGEQVGTTQSGITQAAAADVVANPSQNRLSKESLMQKSRHFQIDVYPKYLFADGSLIRLLVTSNVAQYVEFVAIDRILATSAVSEPTTTAGPMEMDIIPCTRSELFNTRRLTLAEKRLMTNLVSFCVQQTSTAADNEASNWPSFGAFIREKFRLTPKLLRFVATINAVMHNGVLPQAGVAPSQPNDTLERFLDNVSTVDGIEAMRRFLSSLGRYGNTTPFLVTRFGTNEILQGFTRFSAVFGGIYCLRRQANALIIAPGNSEGQEQTCVGVLLDNGQRIKVKCAIISAESIPDGDSVTCNSEDEKNRQCHAILRAAFITEKSLFADLSDSNADTPKSRNMLVLPIPSSGTDGTGSVATLVELDATSGCAPRGFFLVQLVSVRTYSDSVSMHREAPGALNELVDYVSRTVFSEYDSNGANNSEKPAILYRCSFIVKDCTHVSQVDTDDATRNFRLLKHVNNVFALSGHDANDADCSRAVKEARELFHATSSLLGHGPREFMPRAPDPEDIVLEADQPSNESEPAPAAPDSSE